MSDPLRRLADKKVERVRDSLQRRHGKERRFRTYGLLSIFFAVAFLTLILTTIFSSGFKAFVSTEVKMTFVMDSQNHQSARSMIRNKLREEFSNVTNRAERRQLYGIVSTESEYILQEQIDSHLGDQPKVISLWLPAGDRFNQYHKGSLKKDEVSGFKSREVAWYRALDNEQRIRTVFNWRFFTGGDSRNPEVAGIAGSLTGSFFTLLLTLILSFPIGVGAAIYLEEYAPKNRITEFIEININNLAAVPSIVFGLLGLAIFLNVLGLPRSTPIVGGLVLTLMTLPTIIISSRASLKAVSPSIRDAALAMGASRTQVVFHHVVPQALPGMFTGSIIGMAQALGETAPLLMIGMVAFIVDVPGGFFDTATALPVQIYLWSENPERGFVELTSAAIIVLLAFLFLMNGVALYLRRKLERK